jgi:predicted small metal-binding protein
MPKRKSNQFVCTGSCLNCEWTYGPSSDEAEMVREVVAHTKRTGHASIQSMRPASR